MREGTTILTLDNGYHLWTHTDNVGGKIRLLCLHGGPGGNHEYYENFAEKLKDIDVQVTMYDQLGSWYSDQPDFTKQENVDKFLKMAILSMKLKRFAKNSASTIFISSVSHGAEQLPKNML